jgi:hypothetical protein
MIKGPPGGMVTTISSRSKRFFRSVAAAGVVTALGVVAFAPPASATGGESSWNLPYGKFTVKSWHCTLYVKSCDWRGETILLNSSGVMDWIQNEATVVVHGVSIAKLDISKAPSASIVFNEKSKAIVRWRKTVANNVNNSGNVYAGYSSTYVSVNSCGSGDGPRSNGSVSAKCVYAGAL